MRTFACLAVAAALSGAPAIVQGQAQTPPVAATDLVRVFLDCNAHGCDDDFFRTEITWVNFVRDRTVAQVHVLVTSESTGSGGARFTVTFDGLADMAGTRDSLTGITQQGDTQDAVRREVMRVLTLGLARYARTTSAASKPVSAGARSASGSTRRSISTISRAAALRSAAA
jgi:hypothetical protein